MHLFCKCGKKDKEVADQIQKLQDGIDGLQDDVSSLTKRLEATIEAQSKVLHLEFIEDTTEALVALTGRIEHLELLKEGNNLHSQEMKSFGREVRNLASRLDRSEERQMSFKSELEKSHEASFQEMRSDLLSCQENLKTLQASFDQGKKESDIFAQAQVQQQEKNHRESHEKAIVRIDEQRQEFQLAQQRVHIELEQLRTESLERLNLQIESERRDAVVRERDNQAFQELRHQEIQHSFQEFRSWMNEEVNHRMRAAEEQVQYFRHHFLHAQEMSNSTFHRKVTWHVGGIRERLRRLVETKGVLSFHSPELHFGGQRLVLELQLPAVEDLQAALDLVGPPPAVPLPGVCAVRIWAKPGCRLSCQLQLGASPPRKAEHTFQASDAMDAFGRVPHQVAHVGDFNEVWDRLTDRLQLSFEVLELQRQRHAVPAGTEEADSHLDELSYTDHLAGEALIQDRLSAELRRLRSLNVRRVEWTLENCQRLLERTQPGHFVESPSFVFAGLDGLQLRLYPKGELQIQGTEIPSCGLFLNCPEPCRLSGTMYIGSRAKAFDFDSDSAGVAGVGKHCVLERQVDASDKVLIVVDVSQVEQDEPSGSSAVCLRSRPELLLRRKLTPTPFEASVRCRPGTAVESRRSDRVDRERSWSRLPLKG